MTIRAPYLPYDELRERAVLFLNEYHSSRTIPVPIEEIIEFDFKMDIVPMPGLHKYHDIDAFISQDLTSIGIDSSVYDSRPGRLRFSLAHELSHRLLHQEVFEQLAFSTFVEWKASTGAIPPDQYKYIEFQANSLAGLILVPPPVLLSEFREAVRMAVAGGVSFDPMTDATQDQIAKYIAGKFGVSSSVIRRRVEYDDLWSD